MVFEDTGAVANSTASTTLDSRKITYSELPVPVRRTADAQIAGGEVNDVERKVRNGQVTYGIGFKGANGTGPQRELVIDAQGNLLRGGRNTATAASAATTPAPASAATSSSFQTMSYNELPESVRRVAEANLSHGHVERVERRQQNGQNQYTLNFKKEDGQYQQMVIAQDGRIVSNQLLPTSAVGAAAGSQSGTVSSAAANRVPLRNSTVVDLSQVPPEVRRVIRDQTGTRNVEEVLRGDWSGKQVYQVTFTDANKNYTELQVDENGQVLYNPGTLNSTSTSPAANLLNNIGRALFNNNDNQ
jgi:uncharacterized membrane protein YkoI